MEGQKNDNVSSGLVLLKGGNSGGRVEGNIPFLVFAVKWEATRWQEHPASSWQLGCTAQSGDFGGDPEPHL